jgi:hypothetical protein
VRDAAGDEAFRAACNTAAELGSATLTAECMDLESLKLSPMTGGGFDKCVETCNIGPVVSGVPPSPALKVTL